MLNAYYVMVTRDRVMIGSLPSGWWRSATQAAVVIQQKKLTRAPVSASGGAENGGWGSGEGRLGKGAIGVR